jgi:chromosome segregation ATPase
MRKCAFGKCAFWALAAAAGLIGGAYLLGFGSHLSTAVNRLSHNIHRQVPPEFEIATIRDQLNQIEPDIKRSLSGLAEESVAVDNLRNDIAEAKVRLEKQKKVVLTMKADLETGAKRVSYRGIELTADELRDRLTQEFDAYKAGENALKAKQEVLKAKQAGLDAAKQKISAMRTAKEQLEAELAKTEAQLKMVQLKETESKFQFDDSRLAAIKQSMRNLKDRVASMEKERQLRIEFSHDEVVNQVEQKVKADEVLKEIDTHFGHTADNNVAAENAEK